MILLRERIREVKLDARKKKETTGEAKCNVINMELPYSVELFRPFVGWVWHTLLLVEILSVKWAVLEMEKPI